MKLGILCATLVATCALPVLAQTTPSLDQRQVNQERRIDQGIKSGELTRQEAKRLEGGQAHLQKMEDKAKADGQVSAQERKRLQHAADQESRKIAREKHDAQHDLDHDGRMDRPHRGPKR